MEERKERTNANEKTVEERIEAVENKLDVILESQATIMNAIGSMICMSEIKKGDIKVKNATLENLISHRDACMKEVHGGSYDELLDIMDEVVENVMSDIINKIFK